MYDFFRAVAAVPEVSVANPSVNCERILKMLKNAEKSNPDFVAFPELCITGYTCGDLFFQSTLLNAAKDALKTLVKTSCELDFPFAVGMPLEIGGKIFNCAVVILKGRVLGIAVKTFVPNYGEFYEKRWFSSACELAEKEIPARILELDEKYFIPVGNDLVFDFCDNVKISVEICEDLWAPIPPSSMFFLGGAEVVINISASNETISKRNYRRSLVASSSAQCMGAYVYASAGNGESTSDLVFSGHSVIAENGTVIAESKPEICGEYLISADIDLGKIRADRRKITTFSDATTFYGARGKVRIVDCGDYDLKSDGSLLKVYKYPFVPTDEKVRVERCLSIFEIQVAGLKKRLKVTGARPVIGVSGGLDSTLALLVCVKAVKELGKPASDVCGITLPCFGTSDRTYNNALALMEKLGITCEEISIKEACMVHFKDIGQNPSNYDLTFENSQARERTQVLMDYAGKIGGLVVGTGDLSELALGWCTYNADHMSMYGVNASIPKTLVRWMVDTIAQNDIFSGCKEILKDISDTPISPELIPPDETGKISQETENIVGPYTLHDFFMYYVLRFGFEPAKIYELAKRAFKDDYDENTILKWLKNFYSRFFTQQFKRNCLPDGVKVGSVCLSPRGDWRMPSDAASKCWLDAVEKLV